MGANSSLTFKGAAFDKNAGRAITGGGMLYINSSHFTYNVVPGAMFGGSVLFAQGGTTVVESSKFLGNAVEYMGGAIAMVGRAKLKVLSSVFEGNQASAGTGGALACHGDSQIEVSDSIFKGNSAALGGGIVMYSNAKGKVYQSNFTSNTAREVGGGIYVSDNVTLNITDTMLIANEAQAKGGALGLAFNAIVRGHNVSFKENKARLAQGGAVVVNMNATLVLVHADIHSNVAMYGGGLFANGGTHMALSLSHLINNTAQAGGAICMSEFAAVLMREIKGYNNSAAHGGVIYSEQSAQATIHDSMFDRNLARKSHQAREIVFSGGFLHAEGSAAIAIHNTTIEGHVSQPDAKGGAVDLYKDARLNLTSSTLSHHHASVGGGIAMNGNSSVYAHNTTMTNTSASDGGALHITPTCFGCSVAWLGSRFVNTSATDNGGAMLVGNGAVVLENITFVNSQAHSHGGAIAVTNEARMSMKRCTIRGCRSIADEGGGLLAIGHSQINLSRCTITGCTAKSDGGAIFADEAASLQMQSCQLHNNSATSDGGGLCVAGSAHLVANECKIMRNGCLRGGGGLVCGGSASVQLQSCVVSDNHADYGGGMFIGDKAAMTLQQTTIIGNRALRLGGGVALGSANFDLAQMRAATHGNQAGDAAPDVYVVPTSMVVTNSSSVERFVSRLNSDDGLVDMTLRVSGAHGLPSEGIPVVVELQGVALASTRSGADGLAHLSVKLRKPPGTYKLTIDSSIGNPLSMVVHVVNCSTGDVTARTGDACQTCDWGWYSLDPRNSTCDHCVPNAVCKGGASIAPLPGWWHSSPRSVQIHRCLNAEACTGINANLQSQPLNGDAYKSAQCAAGYEGNLCGLCHQGYGTLKPLVCKKCLSKGATIALYALAALVMLVAVRVLSALALSADSGQDTGAAKPVDILKPLVLYAQWLLVVCQSMNNVPLPPSLAVPLQAVSWFWSSTSASSLGLDCVLPRLASVPVPAQKVMFALLTPVAILCVLLCVELLLSLRCRSTRRRPRMPVAARQGTRMRDRVMSLFVCMAFMFLPTWAHAAFSFFACVQLDAQVSFPYGAEAVGLYWIQDLSTQCYAGYHKPWAFGVGLPLLLLLCLALPLGLLVFLVTSSRRGKLTEASFRQQYGFLYRSWRLGVYWYEAVVVVQTNALVLVGTFGYALGPYYHLLVILAALGLIGVLLLYVRPHKCAEAGHVSLHSVGVLCLTTFSALTFLPYRNITPPPGYTMAMGVVVLLAHVAFVLCTLWRLLRIIDWSLLMRCVRCCYQKAACCCKAESCQSGPAGRVVATLRAPMCVGSSLLLLKACCTCHHANQQSTTCSEDASAHGAGAKLGV